jgi:penicillin-binding protein 1A
VPAKKTLRKKDKPRNRWWRRLKIAMAFMALVFLGSFTAFAVYFTKEVREAADAMSTIGDRMAQVVARPSVIKSVDGHVLYQVSSEYRTPVKLSEIPPHVRNAMLAAEDKRFYEHDGVDLISLSRAMWSLVREKRATQGGSTLTMQLAKQLYSGSEKTFQRKLQDIALAYAMEHKLSKDQILDLYLNHVFFGETAHGIGAAAKVYFNKDVKDLTVAEAAMLARCVQRPSQVNPFKTPERSLANRNVVLRIMREEGMISETEFAEAVEEEVKLNPNPPTTTARKYGAPYFVDHVLEEMERLLPHVDLKMGGYVVETTLDFGLQKKAEAAVAKIVRDSRRQGVTTGAFVAIDRDGRIIVEVGGVDYERNEYNAIYKGRRQPGSAFKPFVYATAMQMGVVGLNSRVDNTELRIPDQASKTGYYSPKNLGSSRWGSTVSMHQAFGFSINRPAVHTIMNVGPETVVAASRDVFGFRTRDLPAVPSLALGSCSVSPLELAEAYSVFMLKGDRVQPYAIHRVIGPDGSIVKQFEPVKRRSVLDPMVVADMDALMEFVVRGGTGTVARAVPNARGKTGTTNDSRDAWFCGYTDGLVGIGWVASEHREGNRWVYRAMPNVYGGNTTVRIWTEVMKEVHKKYASPVAEPSGGDYAPGAVIRPPTPPEDATEPALREDPGGEPPPIDDYATDDPADAPRRRSDPPPAGPEDLPGQPASPPPITPAASTRNPNPDPGRDRDRDRERQREAERASTDVEICVDTQLRANMYCPETVFRRIASTRVPGNCRRHGSR